MSRKLLQAGLGDDAGNEKLPLPRIDHAPIVAFLWDIHP